LELSIYEKLLVRYWKFLFHFLIHFLNVLSYLFTNRVRENIFRAWEYYLRYERRRSECFICANVPNTSSRIEVCTIFFETNITSMSDLSCTICEQMALAKVSIELEQRFISLFRYLQHPNWRNGDL
jgi:hypothetical protein